ncbi:MAG: hypothetical protein ACM3ZV_12820 [Bacillota bacterium]
MAGKRFGKALGLFIAGSMIFSSTGAVAATSLAPASQPDAWAALSIMNGGASAAALCGAAAATAATAATAAQPAAGCVLPQVDVVAPPAQPQTVVPVETAAPAPGVPLAVLALGALLAAAVLYAILHNNNHHNPQPNSPA